MFICIISFNLKPQSLIESARRGNIEEVKKLIKLGAHLSTIEKMSLLHGRYVRRRLTMSNNKLQKIINLINNAYNIEVNIESFKNQSDDIKEILIKRWINQYQRYNDTQALERLKTILGWAKESKTPSKILTIEQEIKIRNALAKKMLLFSNSNELSCLNVVTK